MSLSTRRVFAFLILFLAANVAPASAQLCAGRPEFYHYRWQTSLGIPLDKHVVVQGLTTSLGTGRDSLFAIANAKIVRGSTASAYTLALNVGSDFRVIPALRLHMCPTITGLKTWGPDTKVVVSGVRKTIVNASTEAWEVGGRIGLTLNDNTAARQFGPTLGVHMVRQRTSRTSFTGSETRSSETYGVAEAGFALLVAGQAALTPTISIPFKSDTASVELLVLMTFNFGAR